MLNTRFVLWLIEFGRALVMWPFNLVRDFPGRVARLLHTLLDGLGAILVAIPGLLWLLSRGTQEFRKRVRQTPGLVAAWLVASLMRLFDLPGGPELVELILRLGIRATPLTATEIGAGQRVLGEKALRWQDVRIGQGGLLRRIFSKNDNRAFTVFRTINMPDDPDGGRPNLAIVVHELVHVLQYEANGSLYMAEALRAQRREGHACYSYGEGPGLCRDRAAGKRFRDYNREQQAQIAQDYFDLCKKQMPTTEYDVCIEELQRGEL